MQAAVAATTNSADSATTASDSGSATVQKQKPRLLSVKGKVYDVSSSAAFGSGGPLQCLGMHACKRKYSYIYTTCVVVCLCLLYMHVMYARTHVSRTMQLYVSYVLWCSMPQLVL
jgi:hypothetical protein